MDSLTLPVLGMSCAACQHHVEQTLRPLPGVSSVRVDLLAHRAHIVFDSAQTPAPALVDAIRRAGYDAVLPRASEPSTLPDRAAEAQQARLALRKAVLLLAAGLFVMLFSMPLMPSMSPAEHWLMSFLPALPPSPLRWTLLFVTTALAFWAGRSVYANAFAGLRHGRTNMNTLVSLGTLVALGWSAIAVIAPRPGQMLYFDAVLMILGFLVLGKALEARAKSRALDAVRSLAQLEPRQARRVRADVEELVDIAQIAVGDHIRILAGERIPVDAELISGRTTVDESLLTGESTPVSRLPGDRLLAGSLNYDGAVLCRATSLGADTVLGQLRRLVDEAQSSRAPLEQLADRASAIFVPVVLLLAVLTALVWLLFAGPQPALAHAVAVLVVACPCAMGLAIPAALTVAVGRGAQLGVLFKGGEALERLAHLDEVLFDKTGTLTEGRPQVVSVHSLQQDAAAFLALVASAEQLSSHPLAEAVVRHALAQNLTWQPASDVQTLPGRGLSATASGHSLLVGNAALFSDWAIPLPSDAPNAGRTRLWVAIDGQLSGWLDAEDRLRPDAASAVAHLHARHITVRMLTGDTLSAAQPIAALAHIQHVEAALDPLAKLERLRHLQQQGLRVAMVGDGINDAAALAQADAGLAMGSGAALAQEAGDVLLLRPLPSLIPLSIDLARATLATMRQNLAWAIGYNLIGIPLAAGLLEPSLHIALTPWMAAAAMAFSSVSVLANSLRLLRWRPIAIN